MMTTTVACTNCGSAVSVVVYDDESTEMDGACAICGYAFDSGDVLAMADLAVSVVEG